MPAIELKQNMTRDYKSRGWIAMCGVGGKRVVARHVCVNDLNLILFDEACELVGTCDIECIAQWQELDLLVGQASEARKQRRIGPDHGIKVVAAPREFVAEIGEMALASTECLS